MPEWVNSLLMMRCSSKKLHVPIYKRLFLQKILMDGAF
jgi:hypothetical protein